MRRRAMVCGIGEIAGMARMIFEGMREFLRGSY